MDQRRPPDSQGLNKLLRENDISTGGSAANFVIWMPPKKRCGVGHGAGRLPGEERSPHDLGQCRVRLADGKSVACETVWDAFRREADGYAPEKVAAITGVLPKIS